MKFGEDLFNNELRPAPSVAAISRSVRSSITAHSANDRFAPEAAVHPESLSLRSDNKKNQKATRALHRMAFVRLSP